jgi:hypothetical protein
MAKEQVARKTSTSEILRSHIWNHTVVSAELLVGGVSAAALLWILDGLAPQHSWLIGWVRNLDLWFIVLTFAQFALCGLLVLGIYNIMTVSEAIRDYRKGRSGPTAKANADKAGK